MLDKIGIIGLGTIGSKLTAYLAFLNIQVTAYCRRNKDAHNHTLEDLLLKRYAGIKDEINDRISVTDDLRDLKELPLIIDATSESYDNKRQLYSDLIQLCSPNTILACTTSSLDLNLLANYYRPGSFVGFHVFNPPDKMQLIEISVGENVSPACKAVINDLKQLLIDKVIVELPIIQGYVVNRLLFIYLNAAYNFHLSTGISFDKIDVCMKYGTNVPMGPFTLSDYIGNDICLEIIEQMYQTLKLPEYKPSQLIIDYVNQGKLGRKTHSGFYEYPQH